MPPTPNEPRRHDHEIRCRPSVIVHVTLVSPLPFPRSLVSCFLLLHFPLSSRNALKTCVPGPPRGKQPFSKIQEHPLNATHFCLSCPLIRRPYLDFAEMGRELEMVQFIGFHCKRDCGQRLTLCPPRVPVLFFIIVVSSSSRENRRRHVA